MTGRRWCRWGREEVMTGRVSCDDIEIIYDDEVRANEQIPR
jgi:hypothetical protein